MSKVGDDIGEVLLFDVLFLSRGQFLAVLDEEFADTQDFAIFYLLLVDDGVDFFEEELLEVAEGLFWGSVGLDVGVDET